MRRHIRMEDPTPLGKYLGCSHSIHTCNLDLSNEHMMYRWPPDPPVAKKKAGVDPADSPTGGFQSDSEDESESELSDRAVKSRRVAGKPAHASKRVKGNDTTVRGLGQDLGRETDKVNRLRNGKHVVRCIVYDMSDFLRSCVDRYLELANKHVASLRTSLRHSSRQLKRIMMLSRKSSRLRRGSS